jgi:ubiquinone/menaquinone biosynthesis C-methylase UbiE
MGGGRARRNRPFFARLWLRMAPSVEQQGAGEHRAGLLADVGGRVLEVGAGTGSNFPHYPAAVSEVLAVEPEPRLRARAGEAARSVAVPVSVVDGVADRLPADDGSVDAVVATLVLCSVPDQGTALAEIRRVLRPGGRLFFWEHVRGETPRLARVQRVLDATIWPLLGGGCHTGRDTVAAIEAAGFTLERLERFRFPESGPTMPASPHVLGVAVRTVRPPSAGGGARPSAPVR